MPSTRSPGDDESTTSARDNLSSAADAAAVYFGLPAPLYICNGCERRPRFDGRCGCS